jgi:hypothetical protein
MIRTLTILIALCLSPSAVNALCVSTTQQDETQACVNLGAGFSCVQYADLDPGGGDKQADQLAGVLQAMIDVRQTLASLPVDDPDKTIDPDLPSIFHADTDGDKTAPTLEKDHLVSRCADVIVLWDKDAREFVITYSRTR